MYDAEFLVVREARDDAEPEQGATVPHGAILMKPLDIRWKNLVLHFLRIMRLRRIFAHLGQFLQMIKKRGRELVGGS